MLIDIIDSSMLQLSKKGDKIMLRNKLAVLIAERELTAAKVSEETGIARSTLSSLVNNTGDGVQYKTLDKLCNYFGITPSEFFDYAPFILKYNFDIPEYRKRVIKNVDSEKEKILSSGNTEERANFLINEYLDIFGEARYIIEIFVNKKMKQIKYSMCINIYKISPIDESNAPEGFDIEIILEDNYNGKSFIADVYENVSIIFQTQIKNTCFELIEQNIVNEDLQNCANRKNKPLKIFLETPFGDKELTIKPIK